MARPFLHVTDNALSRSQFRRAFDALEAVGDRASYWRTFWFPIGAAPTNVAEALVPTLAAHVPRSQKHLIGVEWWIGRMRTDRVLLDFHHDRDLQLFEETGRLRFPVWSSVLFFTRTEGGSLFVTDQRLRQRGSELRLSPQEPRLSDAAHPKPNRYAVFPGHLFHGVLDARDQVPSRPLPKSEGQLRLSLVVNWWDRRPRGVKTWAESRAYRELAIPSGRSAAPRRTTAR